MRLLGAGWLTLTTVGTSMHSSYSYRRSCPPIHGWPRVYPRAASLCCIFCTYRIHTVTAYNTQNWRAFSRGWRNPRRSSTSSLVLQCTSLWLICADRQVRGSQEPGRPNMAAVKKAKVTKVQSLDAWMGEGISAVWLACCYMVTTKVCTLLPMNQPA